MPWLTLIKGVGVTRILMGIAIAYLSWMHFVIDGPKITRLEDNAKEDAKEIARLTDANDANLKSLGVLRDAIAEAAATRKALGEAYAADVKRRDEANLHLQRMAERKEHAAHERPEVLERTIRAAVNKRLRDAARETCIADCQDGNGKGANHGSAATVGNP